jgi:hypothetical protein
VAISVERLQELHNSLDQEQKEEYKMYVKSGSFVRGVQNLDFQNRIIVRQAEIDLLERLIEETTNEE